ncbi:HNH endonuclease signature motif containing protein [Paraburkholderia sp. RL18-101-BIB-B]|jgi:putative restriction endonuclease|uniref:HNH endonuclease n=1 Tax=Paraburkholderia sp. RL18-101-BIB-B TaxID=3031634 RepID=UPI0038B85CEE
MSNPRAWSLLAVDGARQYGGNTGYQDDPSQVYRYDSFVANYQQVSKNDVVVIRSSTGVLGAAQITGIELGKGEKERQRCPICGVSDIKRRTTIEPPWVCRNRHEFSEPVRETVTVDTFAAHYGESFRSAPPGLTLDRLAAAVVRPNDQMSIKEIDLARIEPWLRDDPDCNSLVKKFVIGIDIDTVSTATNDDPPHSVIEARRRVLRELNQRRGQAKFRNRLIARYGAACQISRCAFPGLMEAAHIRPYAETNDNGAHNGLLLRSDLHTLFDLDLLAIDPSTLTVKLHPDVCAAGYEAFDGTPLFLNGTSGPDLAALFDRWESFQLRQTP